MMLKLVTILIRALYHLKQHHTTSCQSAHSLRASKPVCSSECWNL